MTRKKVEMRFAHLKVHHRFERMRLRGLTRARDEFHLAAIVQNLKTLASPIWRPPLKRARRVRVIAYYGSPCGTCARRSRNGGR